MNRYYKKEFDTKVIKIGETPIMNENTVFPQILESHMTPKGKWGKLVVLKGNVNYKWHDDETVYTADSENPIVIEPERLHNVILNGPAEFRVEFYKTEENENHQYNTEAKRPGENFI